MKLLTIAILGTVALLAALDALPQINFAHGLAGRTTAIKKIRDTFHIGTHWFDTVTDIGDARDDSKVLGSLTEEQIAGIIDSRLNRKNAIDQAREQAFGGGLLKGLAGNPYSEQGRYARKRVREFFDFMNAVQLHDGSYIRKQQEAWRNEYKSQLTEEEFKALDPNIEGTDSKGGYMVPPEFAADLARLLGEYGYARKYCRTWSMSGKVLDIASLATKPSVAFVGEASAIAASQPVYGQTVLTAKKIAAIWTASNEFLADANIDVYNAILEIFAEQFALTEDTNVFTNSNTNWTGLLYRGDYSHLTTTGAYRGDSSTSGLTGYPQIGDSADNTKDILADMTRMMYTKLNKSYLNGALFFMPQECLGAILTLRDSSKRVMLDLDNSGLSIKAGLDGAPALYFHGAPIIGLPTGVMITTYDAAAHVTDPFMIYGNLQRAWATLGVRGGFEIFPFAEGTVDGSSMVEKDLRGIRMTERLAFDTALPLNIVALNTSAS